MADKEKKKDEEPEKKGAEGAEGAEGAAVPTPEEEEAAKKKKKRKMMMIAAAAAVLLGATAGGLYFGGAFTDSTKTEAAGKKGKKKKKSEEEGGERGTTGSSAKTAKQNFNEWVPGVVPGHEGDDVVYYNLAEFLVNLNTSGKQTSFIKMKVTLELPSDADADALDGRMPRVTDSFNTYLRELRTTDIAGSAGLYRLREELLLRVNKIIYPNKVNDVLYREIIIQ